MLLYYSFDTTNTDLNKITNVLDLKNSINYSDIYTTYHLYNEDNPLLFNFATNYNWNDFNPGKTMTSISEKTGSNFKKIKYS